MPARSHCSQYFKEILGAIIQFTGQQAAFYIRLLCAPRSQNVHNMAAFFLWNFVFNVYIFFYLYIVFNRYHDQYQCNVYMYIVDLVHCCTQAPMH